MLPTGPPIARIEERPGELNNQARKKSSGRRLSPGARKPAWKPAKSKLLLSDDRAAERLAPAIVVDEVVAVREDRTRSGSTYRSRVAGDR
jgi:hypothetical protein